LQGQQPFLAVDPRQLVNPPVECGAAAVVVLLSIGGREHQQQYKQCRDLPFPHD
jgi:hypothetical protein